MYFSTIIWIFLILVALLILTLVLRFAWVMMRRKSRPLDPDSLAKVMIVAGSGGHTTEILRLLSCLSLKYQPRIYIVAQTDHMSTEKIKSFENNRKKQHGKDTISEYTILSIPRSREVRQSWVTTIFTTLSAVLFSVPLVFRQRPDLLLSNGPGTCIPICFAALAMKLVGYKNVTVVFVESICRVRTLSLSGKIMYYIADHFLVQWKQLLEHFPRAVYLGRLV